MTRFFNPANTTFSFLRKTWYVPEYPASPNTAENGYVPEYRSFLRKTWYVPEYQAIC